MDGMELGPGPSAVRMPSNTAVWRGRIFLRPAETGPSIGAASITNCCAPENSGYSGLPNITGSHYDYRPASAISQTNEDGITNPQVKAKTIHGQFKIGYVIKLLWVEPRGESSRNSERSRNGEDTDVTDDDGPSSTKGFSKTRRFVIVKVFTGHCTCQGVVKRGVHPEVHAAVFTADGPKLAPGEADVLTRPPIRFLSKSPREKLDPMTRLNYAKLYTVEYNIKLRFIDVSASSGREPASLSQGEDSSAASRFGYGYTNQRLSGSTSSFNRPQENPKNCWQDDPAAAGSGHGNSSISNAESPSDRPRASDYGEDDPPALGTYVSSRNRGKTPIETYDHHDDLYDDN
ncbi:hypothetical protein M7I_1013 [Glarea lozoyensis 74030]|uniref:DUF6590 domain-containing protein n=1 Tax=Glarea lozoyensis (strain ATCC 74030 / MF5533) TaxID=1104152 RepID=H0EEX6_GLAL7|nr:hypothetical protein M7I_1013 [Glarea lozoyensis 74030]